MQSLQDWHWKPQICCSQSCVLFRKQLARPKSSYIISVACALVQAMPNCNGLSYACMRGILQCGSPASSVYRNSVCLQQTALPSTYSAWVGLQQTAQTTRSWGLGLAARRSLHQLGQKDESGLQHIRQRAIKNKRLEMIVKGWDFPTLQYAGHRQAHRGELSAASKVQTCNSCCRHWLKGLTEQGCSLHFQ